MTITPATAEPHPPSPALPNRKDPFPLSLAAGSWPWRIDVTLYSILVFATAAFSRNFAWLHLRVYSSWPYVQFFAKPQSDSFAQSLSSSSGSSGLPIFVTEWFLALLVLCVVVRRRPHGVSSVGSTWFDRFLLVWMVVGLYDLARGLSVGPAIALRDSAIIYYAIFFYIARAVCDSWNNIVVVCLAFWLGTIVSLFAATCRYVNIDFLPHIDWPARGQFLAGSYGVYFLLVILTGMTLWPRLERTAKWILFVYLSFATFALVFPQQRSLIFAFVVGLSVLLVVGRAAAAVKVLPLWRMAGGVAAAALILETARFATASPQSLETVQELVAKTRQTVAVATSSPDDRAAPSALQLTGTARFRQDAWAEAWKRWLDHPMIGEGFGRPFVFYDTVQRRWWTDDVRPHNAYLTILYKMGILGFAAFALVHLAFYRTVWGALRRNRPSAVTPYVFGLLSSLIGWQVYACFNLLFESPFVAVVYWSVMGLIISLIRIGRDAAVVAPNWTPSR